MKNLNILIVGVGGQGNLLASRILGSVALKMGFDVKLSEVHGMSQRGGSVTTYVRMAEKVYSPLIDKQQADFILAFESLEALRYGEYLKKDGTFVINSQKITPLMVATGKEKYPTDIPNILKGYFKNVIEIDALSIAKEVRSPKSVNIVMLGAMAKMSGIPIELFHEAIKETVPQKLIDVNISAFEKAIAAINV